MTHPRRTHRTEALTPWPTPATEILTERAARAHEFYPDDRTAREAFLARAAQAIAVADIIERLLHRYWRSIDHAIAAGTTDGPGWWDLECASRTRQEEVIAEYAFAYVDQTVSQDLLGDLEMLLIIEVGFDLRDPRIQPPASPSPDHPAV